MKEILLTNERFVRETSGISDNLAGRYILPSIREAQNVYYRGIVGDALLDKLKALVDAGTIGQAGNEAYKALLEKSQYYITYRAVVEVAQHVNFKVANAGVIQTPDENMPAADHLDMCRLQDYYVAKADSMAMDLQGYLLDNRASFPELCECDCNRIKANLYSAASCGIFLGGPRGKTER